MESAMTVVALALVVAALLMLLVLAFRRIALARRERRHAESERRVRPLALAIVEGSGGEPPALSAGDQAVLAEVLGRYSRALRGDADRRIAAYFRESPALATATRELGSRRMWRRAAAAYSLGDMRCAEAAPALLRALDDDKPEVRGAVARSLGRLGVHEAALPLVEAFASRRVSTEVVGEALIELGPGVVPELRNMAGHPDSQIRAAAITLLGLVGDSGDSPVAIGALRDSSADVRRAGAEALRRIGSSDAEAALRASLDDRAEVVRAAAAESLGVIGSRSAAAELLEVARNDEFRPAHAAAEALARIDPGGLAAAAAEQGAGSHLREAADLRAL
jgi:HEAT repeat protein